MIELVRQRRSIRSYRRDPVDPQTVYLLVETLLRAPTSRNIRPWEFIVVDDRELLAKLSACKEHGSAFLKGAPLAVVVCGDETRSDVWVEDCSIATILLQMTAQSLGLGSCWIQIRRRQHDAATPSEEYIRRLLGLPEQLKVQAIVALGHPSEKREPLPASELQYGKVKRNGYAEPYRTGD
ncbi:MAG TPA: nitroreductase family protein [Verrucomicrobiae bacterium]|nr:nitroreductase family protein [Verrucomicrobiae bacterium]